MDKPPYKNDPLGSRRALLLTLPPDDSRSDIDLSQTKLFDTFGCKAHHGMDTLLPSSRVRSDTISDVTVRKDNEVEISIQIRLPPRLDFERT